MSLRFLNSLLWKTFHQLSQPLKTKQKRKKMSTKWGFIQENYHILYDVSRCYCTNINAFTQSTPRAPQHSVFMSEDACNSVTSEHPRIHFSPSFTSFISHSCSLSFFSSTMLLVSLFGVIMTTEKCDKNGTRMTSKWETCVWMTLFRQTEN